MKKFIEYSRQIDEKQIQYGKNANYGQVVFFAGGAASGKGFALTHYIDSTKFKVYDVDELKLKLTRMPNMRLKYPGIDKLSLKNPEDVRALHAIAKKENIPEKELKAWIETYHHPDVLPNLLFDMTLKDLDNVNTILPSLLKAGYKPHNIHLTWILANFDVAVSRNSSRERVVPEDILLVTHQGAALTMANILAGNLPRGLDGSVTIVLNNPEEVKFYTTTDKSGKPVVTKTVKDFTYIIVKGSSRPIISFPEMDKQIREKLFSWVVKNAPQTKEIERAYGIG